MGTDRRGFLAGLLGAGAALLEAGKVAKGESKPDPVPHTPAARQAYATNMFFVAGFQYHHGPTVVHKMREGDPLDMIPEPHNPHDPLAVRLEWNGIMIGYVPRAENQVVNALLQQDAPLEAFIYEVDPDADPWQAVMAEVLLVT